MLSFGSLGSPSLLQTSSKATGAAILPPHHSFSTTAVVSDPDIRRTERTME